MLAVRGAGQRPVCGLAQRRAVGRLRRAPALVQSTDVAADDEATRRLAQPRRSAGATDVAVAVERRPTAVHVDGGRAPQRLVVAAEAVADDRDDIAGHGSTAET